MTSGKSWPPSIEGRCEEMNAVTIEVTGIKISLAEKFGCNGLEWTENSNYRVCSDCCLWDVKTKETDTTEVTEGITRS